MKVLVVEDEAILGTTLVSLLEQQGYRATWADSVDAAWEALADQEPELIALDVMLPEGEDAGFRFAAQLREAGTTIPILFLSARDTVADRINGLDLGGDDYLVKPYSLDEFLARVRALMRREVQTKQTRFVRGPLEIDFRQRMVRYHGSEIDLSEREYELLELFAKNPDRTYSSEELLDRLFPGADSGTRVIRVYVHYLRQKLGRELVRTTRGGYRLGL